MKFYTGFVKRNFHIQENDVCEVYIPELTTELKDTTKEINEVPISFNFENMDKDTTINVNSTIIESHNYICYPESGGGHDKSGTVWVPDVDDQVLVYNIDGDESQFYYKRGTKKVEVKKSSKRPNDGFFDVLYNGERGRQSLTTTLIKDIVSGDPFTGLAFSQDDGIDRSEDGNDPSKTKSGSGGSTSTSNLFNINESIKRISVLPKFINKEIIEVNGIKETFNIIEEGNYIKILAPNGEYLDDSLFSYDSSNGLILTNEFYSLVKDISIPDLKEPSTSPTPGIYLDNGLWLTNYNGRDIVIDNTYPELDGTVREYTYSTAWLRADTSKMLVDEKDNIIDHGEVGDEIESTITFANGIYNNIRTGMGFSRVGNIAKEFRKMEVIGEGRYNNKGAWVTTNSRNQTIIITPNVQMLTVISSNGTKNYFDRYKYENGIYAFDLDFGIPNQTSPNIKEMYGSFPYSFTRDTVIWTDVEFDENYEFEYV